MERTVNNGSQFIINSLPNQKPMKNESMNQKNELCTRPGRNWYMATYYTISTLTIIYSNII